MPPFNKKQLRTPRTHLAHGPSVDSDNQLRHSLQGIRNERHTPRPKTAQKKTTEDSTNDATIYKLQQHDHDASS